MKEPLKKLWICRYSPKAIAVYGEDTRKLTQELTKLKFRFNRNLRHPHKPNKTAGWIASIKHEANFRRFCEIRNIILTELTKLKPKEPVEQRDYIPDPAELASDQFVQRNNI